MFSDKIFLKIFKKNWETFIKNLCSLKYDSENGKKKINTFYINDIVVQIFMAVNYS